MAGIRFDITTNSQQAVTGITNVTRSLQKLPKTSGDATRSLQKLPKTTTEATQSMINLSRIAQDMPYGFLGIANNLNPLLESFQRLKTSAGSSGAALKALGKELGGAGGLGLALGIGSALLVKFGDSLFAASFSFSKAEIAAAKFTIEIKNAKDGIEQFNDYLSFQLDLTKLNNLLNLGEGFAADQKNLRDEFDKNNQVIANSQGIISKYNKEIDNVRHNAKFFLGKAGQRLLTEFPVFADIPDNLIEKLNKSDELLVKTAKANSQLVQDEYKRIIEASRKNQQIQIQLMVNQNKENLRLYEKSQKDYEAYVNSIIAKGKELASFFKDVAIVPEFGIFDSTTEQFKKALKFIQDIDTGDVKLKLKVAPVVDVTGPEVEKPESIFDDFFKSEQAKYFAKPEKIDFSLINIEADWEEHKKEAKKQLEEIGRIGEFVGNQLADAFDSVFDALASGQNPIRALGEAIKELVIDLIKAAIRAFIVKQIMNLLAPGLGTALGPVSILPRASGGPVSARTPYIIGENGPELFVPNTAGRIIPNNRLGGLVGSAERMIGINIQGRISGRDIVYSYTQEQSYQRRNG